jgi:hypothetical protein
MAQTLLRRIGLGSYGATRLVQDHAQLFRAVRSERPQ